MKTIYLIMFLFLFSCSNNNSEDIKDVEYFLGTTIPYNVKNFESSTEGLKQSIKTIDITLNEEDYIHLIKKINLKEYEKYHDSYYKQYYLEKEDKHLYLTLYPKEHRIRYAEKF